jgi:hypothetical protein
MSHFGEVWGFLMHRVEHLPSNLAGMTWSIRTTDCQPVRRAIVHLIVLRLLTESE